jgi:hypothetical protein
MHFSSIEREGAMPLGNGYWSAMLVGTLSSVQPVWAQVLEPVEPTDIDYHDDTVPDYEFDAEPGLVEVEPGIGVVPDIAQEVFFVDGWYWCYWHGRWFHSCTWQGAWSAALPPPRIAAFPHGRYSHWHDGRMIRPGHGAIHHAPIAPQRE